MKSALTVDENEWPARVEALAVEAEPAALKEAPAKLAGYRADHKADAASYRFDCRRHGDFLAVFVERGGEKRAVTINLSLAATFGLAKGRAPDNGGVLTYSVRAETIEGGGPHTFSQSASTDRRGRITAPSAGHRYVVTPQHPYVAERRPLVATEGAGRVTRENCYWNGYSEPRIAHVTPNYPRPAEDDRVEFGGAGITIHAPAGRGRGVLDRIHAELAKQ